MSRILSRERAVVDAVSGYTACQLMAHLCTYRLKDFINAQPSSRTTKHVNYDSVDRKVDWTIV